MVAGHERGDGGGQFPAEGGTVSGGTETNDRVDRERGETFIEIFGAVEEIADFADDAASKGEKKAGRETIGGAPRVGGDGAHGGGRDHIRGCGGNEEAFGQAAPAA